MYKKTALIFKAVLLDSFRHVLKNTPLGELSLENIS